jgi:hypothetical protein
MKFSFAATAMLCAVAANNAAAFAPSRPKAAFGIQQQQQKSSTSTRTSTSTSPLFVLNEDAISTESSTKSSTFIKIEESNGHILPPPRSLEAARQSTKSYLSQYHGQSGAAIIYSKLVENGVSVVNGYSGGAVLPLLDQFHEDHPRHGGKPSIRWITNSNENSAGHIAEGYSKAAPNLHDNKPPAGVVVATSGPGVTVLDIPNEIKVGYSPIGFVRCGRSACRISKLKWKMGKETGGKKMEDPHSLKSNEMAQCSFQPQQPLVCDTFKNCEGLSRVAFIDGNGVVMLGKVISCERKEDASGGGKKK